MEKRRKKIIYKLLFYYLFIYNVKGIKDIFLKHVKKIIWFLKDHRILMINENEWCKMCVGHKHKKWICALKERLLVHDTSTRRNKNSSSEQGTQRTTLWSLGSFWHEPQRILNKYNLLFSIVYFPKYTVIRQPQEWQKTFHLPLINLDLG